MTISGGVLQHNHTGGNSGGASLLSHVPPGTFYHCGHANDPGANAGDYLECNGQNVSRTTYAALFVKIGTTWGIGDGSTTYTLPDARRRSPVGKGGVGTGTLGNAVGNTGGEETHVQITAEIGTHGHPQVAHAHGIPANLVGDGGAGSLYPGGGFGNTVGVAAVTATDGATTTGNTGSSTGMNVYSPAYICGVWIKT
jgi:microcystin-dependent protein